MIDLKEHRSIHCIGIGGIGLSAIAKILLARGYNVSGSDMKESDMTESLAAAGARICIGHRAENVQDADLIVYSSAVGADNPELAEAKRRGIQAVVTTIPAEQGWQVTVDGEPVETGLFLGAFLALELEPGAHTVELTYTPPGLTPALGLLALALAGGAVSLFLGRRRGNKLSR